MTVLVTGAGGFLGLQLVRGLLDRGRMVRAFIHRPLNQSPAHVRRVLSAAAVEVVTGDLLDAHALQQALCDVSHVFHMAGRLLVPGVPAASYERIHIAGTRTLLTACAATRGLQAVVHCSTTGVLGPTGPTPADETAPIRPGNIYEQTKAAGEQLAMAMAEVVPVVIARPALVYGPGDLHLLGWFRAIQRGLYRVVGSGRSLLHPIYIDDLIAGLLRCSATPPARGRVYHLVGERPFPIGELAETIARALGRRLPAWHLPIERALQLAALCEAVPGVPPAYLPLTRSRITFMSEDRAYSGARAGRELQFVPHTDLASGLAATVDWYRSEGLL